MNPDVPITPQEEQEARLTALLLGELPASEAAAVRQALEHDASLAVLYERLKQTIDLVREVAAEPTREDAPAELARLSEERRQKLLARFKTVTPQEFVRPARKRISWFVPLTMAATLVGLGCLIAFLYNGRLAMEADDAMGRLFRKSAGALTMIGGQVLGRSELSEQPIGLAFRGEKSVAANVQGLGLDETPPPPAVALDTFGSTPGGAGLAHATHFGAAGRTAPAPVDRDSAARGRAAKTAASGPVTAANTWGRAAPQASAMLAPQSEKPVLSKAATGLQINLPDSAKQQVAATSDFQSVAAGQDGLSDRAEGLKITAMARGPGAGGGAKPGTPLYMMGGFLNGDTVSSPSSTSPAGANGRKGVDDRGAVATSSDGRVSGGNLGMMGGGIGGGGFGGGGGMGGMPAAGNANLNDGSTRGYGGFGGISAGTPLRSTVADSAGKSGGDTALALAWGETAHGKDAVKEDRPSAGNGVVSAGTALQGEQPRASGERGARPAGVSRNNATVPAGAVDHFYAWNDLNGVASPDLKVDSYGVIAGSGAAHASGREIKERAGLEGVETRATAGLLIPSQSLGGVVTPSGNLQPAPTGRGREATKTLEVDLAETPTVNFELETKQNSTDLGAVSSTSAAKLPALGDVATTGDLFAKRESLSEESLLGRHGNALGNTRNAGAFYFNAVNAEAKPTEQKAEAEGVTKAYDTWAVRGPQAANRPADLPASMPATPPAFTRPPLTPPAPAEPAVAAGDTVRLNVQVQETEPLSYQWRAGLPALRSGLQKDEDSVERFTQLVRKPAGGDDATKSVPDPAGATQWYAKAAEVGGEVNKSDADTKKLALLDTDGEPSVPLGTTFVTNMIVANGTMPADDAKRGATAGQTAYFDATSARGISQAAPEKLAKASVATATKSLDGRAQSKRADTRFASRARTLAEGKDSGEGLASRSKLAASLPKNPAAKQLKENLADDFTPQAREAALKQALTEVTLGDQQQEAEQLAVGKALKTAAPALAKAASDSQMLGERLDHKAAGADQTSVRKETEPSAPRTPAGPIPEQQPEVSVAENAFSTFSLNVADVSWKLAGASLEKGQMPDPSTVRSEEFINALDYRDPAPPPGAPLAFAFERARYPFAHNRDVVRFALKTAALGRQQGRPLNLVLLLDNSGSMERADRVSIIHEALKVLAAQLQPQDKISVIAFARTARLWIDGLPGSQAGELAQKVGELNPEGGTNLEEAMNLGYATARRHYLEKGINRVVILTDGAANLGNVEPEVLKQQVEENRKQGIALDCFGIGWEGYNDDLLEVLSHNGDGRYGFVNSPEEAATEFAAQLAGALKVTASDVKVQIEFNPRRVTAYRQVGYAKHQLKKEQFRDNTVDAAEIAAEETGNALYILEVNPSGNGPLGTVRVRYKVPGTSDYHELEWEAPYTGGSVPLEQASPALRLAVSSAAFAEWLINSPFGAEVTPDRLLGYLSGVPEIYGADSRPKRLEWMIRQAKGIAGN